MHKIKAIITEIQRASTHDGPGMRTTVFFKGCPLNCRWCHNPECISPEIQMLSYPDKCIGCGMCDKGCYSGAKVACGKEMSAEEIFEEIIRDKDYYGKTGGVTFSGGEPMMQGEMLLALIKKCRTAGINTAMETSLCIFDADILGAVDYVMADFKIFDNKKHKEFVGIDNEIVKENFLSLDKLGVPILVRTPVISGINDTADEIKNIANFLKELKNIVGYELLPYHPLGVTKQEALGIEITRFATPTAKKMEVLKGYADLTR